MDLATSKSKVLIVGGGAVSRRKAISLLHSCAELVVVSKEFTKGFYKLKRHGVRLVEADIENDQETLNKLVSRANIVIAATDDIKLNGIVARTARQKAALVCAVDNPRESDFTFPAVSSLGNIKVAVYTGGRSPMMAGMLARKARRSITREDLRMVRLLGDVRPFVKKRIPASEKRKKVLRDIMLDEKIVRLLRLGRLEEATNIARGIIQSS